MAAAVRIIGCGRWSMGDDQAGLVVAGRLLERNLPRTVVIQDETPGCELACELCDGAELLVVIDAAVADAKHLAGSLYRFDYRERPDILSARSRASTHTLTVDAGLELAETLGLLPEQVWIYVIFGTIFERQQHLSPATQAGIARVVRRIERDVTRWLVAHPHPSEKPSPQ